MNDVATLVAKASHHIAQARAIEAEFKGRPMPAEAGRRMAAHIRIAEEANAELSEPVYKHDMGAGYGLTTREGKVLARSRGRSMWRTCSTST